ncbi:DNA polymerase III subunit delta [Sedimentibacter sp. MB31-C6]|uniref:DNA polymerase III subunit delta n=1 Tax=Sedimentibacter sp. MB31-C6 TaxID=3109366 RepID=UPI002DDD499B|nr:DNA polymerase III subunit delta [Sedimentibacter sp. MB36-C1]WSI03934.1 DNA polymerase III subunit delta [Sedimentibacter sp. MB36-C1]
MSYKIILDLINKSKMPNCVLIYGIEEFLIDKIVKLTKKMYIDENYEDMNYEEFENLENNFDSFKQFVSTFPFMTNKKLCIIKNSSFLTSTGSLNKKEEEITLDFIDKGYDSYIIIFLIKGGKPDLRKKAVKKLKNGNCIFEINKLNEAELSKYILEEFKRNKIDISLSDADYIANNSGYLEYESNISLYEINNEVNKLLSYSMESKRIQREDIDNLMVKSIESNIFKLVDNICEGNKDKGFEVLEEMLLNNTSEQYIIHMIVRQYRMIYQYVLLKTKNYNFNEIMKKMKIKKFVASKLEKQSKKLTLNQIEKYMVKFIEIDRKIKVGEIDKRIGIELITNGIIK